MLRQIQGTILTSMSVGEAESRNFVVAWLKEQAGLGPYDHVITDKQALVRCEEAFEGKGRNARLRPVEVSRTLASEAQIAAWIVITHTCNRGDFSGDKQDEKS